MKTVARLLPLFVILILSTLPASAQLGNATKIWGRNISPTVPTNNQCLVYSTTPPARWVPGSCAAAGSGTVTSVGFTGGVISVANSTTTPAFTVAGTSGGIVYFSDGTHWASSAALAAGAVVLGGGAGTTPATTLNATMSNGALTLGQATSVIGQLKLAGNTSGTVTITPAAAAGTWTMTLPTTGGTNGYCLTTNGSGVTTWTSCGGASGVTSVGGLTGVIGVASGIAVSGSNLVLDSSVLAGVYMANAGSNAILAGTGNTCTPSGTTGCLVLVGAARPSAPAEGTLNVSLAGGLEWYGAATWHAVGSSTSPLTTKGDLYGFSSVDARIPVGTNGQVLTADSTQTLGLKWATVTGTGTVTVVGAGSLTSTALVTGGGTTTLQTPSATSTLDSSGNMALAGSLSLGASPPSLTVGTGFAQAWLEGTNPSVGPASGVDVVVANSSSHALLASFNNGAYSQIARFLDFASPPAIGNTAPAAGHFTTLDATGGISAGSSPPSVTAGTGGVMAGAEGTVPSVCAASAVDCLYWDSTQHGPLLSRNNGSYLPIPQGPASTTANHAAIWNATNGGLLADSGMTLTASTGTFTLTNGKTFAVTNGLTLAGTDSTVMTFPTTSATLARTDAANTFTGTQTIGALVATTYNGNTFTTGTGVLTIAASKTLTVSNSITLAGTDAQTYTFPTTSATMARTDAANTFTGNQTMTALLASASTAVTQSAADNSTKIATTAYVDAAASGSAWAGAFFGGICQNTVGGYALSYPATNAPTPNCNATLITNVLAWGTLDWDDSGTKTAFGTFVLPAGSLPTLNVKLGISTSTTSQQVKFRVYTACVATDETPDPTFNSAQTLTITTSATANYEIVGTQTSVTATGCAAGERLIFKIDRDTTDTSTATARLHWVRWY